MRVWEIKQMLSHLDDNDEVQLPTAGSYGATDFTNFFVLTQNEDDQYYFEDVPYVVVDTMRANAFRPRD
jgi:hypothetical protein